MTAIILTIAIGAIAFALAAASVCHWIQADAERRDAPRILLGGDSGTEYVPIYNIPVQRDESTEI